MTRTWRVGRPSVMHGTQIFEDSDIPMNSKVICTMPARGKGRTADARLIAALPDLLTALQAIHNHLANGDDCPTMCQELARAAITKATANDPR